MLDNSETEIAVDISPWIKKFLLIIITGGFMTGWVITLIRTQLQEQTEFNKQLQEQTERKAEQTEQLQERKAELNNQIWISETEKWIRKQYHIQNDDDVKKLAIKTIQYA